MKEKEIINGFKLLSIKKISDIDSTLYEFEHVKSGASLIYLENEDTNKCFSIGFRTLPEDSTGICHIIEHSLLCGSKKYPLKEPFVNLLKGSMATFLNAMTAYDWTIYPVASQNDKDFNNLMGIYLDAVFQPLSITDNKPFLQEGWHLELNDVDDIPSIKGVVYNEMKGAMSSVDEQLNQATLSALYKGTTYEFNSGGDPDVIPNLTYEYYQNFYHKHYHPGNGLIYLYGKMDLSEKLKYIDEEYLSKYNRSENEIKIEVPKPLVNRDVTKEYEISNEEDEKDNTYMSLAFALDEYKNAQELMAFGILDDALMGTNDSPLKKMLLEAKLGQDIVTTIDDDNILPSYHFYLQKTNKEEKERFYDVLIASCKKLIEEGIDKDLLLATINYREFKNKEMDQGGFPKGLFFAFSLQQSFNYHVDYENYLEYTRYYDFFRQELNNNYFEKLLEKYIVNSKHFVEVVLTPSKTLGIEKEKAFEAKMLELKNKMTLEEKLEAVRITKELFLYQSRKDSKEELDSLPKLALSDIPSDVNNLETIENNLFGFNVLEHTLNTNGIAYLKMYFDLKNLGFEDLPYVTLLTELLGDLDTKEFKAIDLQAYIKKYLGNFSFNNFYESYSSDNLQTKLVLQVSSLKANINKMAKAINEVINHTIFDKEKIKTKLYQIQNILRNQIISDGMTIAMNYASSSKSKVGAIKAKTTGINLYNFVASLIENFDKEDIALKFMDLKDKIFTKENTIISISGNEDVVKELRDFIKKIEISDKIYSDKLGIVLGETTNEALVIPSLVNYNAKAINLKEMGLKASGKLNVLSHILRFDYLWPEIRVKGGAYGSTINLSLNGDLRLGSYRDPNVKNTFDVYDNISKYLEDLNINDDEFISYLIGAIGAYDKPLSNNMQILYTDYYYLGNLTVDKRREFKKEMIETKLEDIKNFIKVFNALAKEGSFYTIGNENKINEFNQYHQVKKLS